MKINLDHLTQEQNQLFNQCALNRRKEFNSLIETVSKNHVHNIDWMVGSLVSRNQYQSDLVRRCREITLIQRMLEVERIDEIVLSDGSLAKLLRNHFDQTRQNIKITSTETWGRILWNLLRPLRQYFISCFFFILRYLGRSKRTIKNPKWDYPVILIDTFVLNNKDGE